MKFEQLYDFILGKLETELSDHLTYHGVHHTLEVLETSQKYIDRYKLSSEEALLVKTAALMHDTGFLFTYKDHETQSKRYAREILPEWGYSSEQIETICEMIEATRIPQQPKSLPAQILADSDLDYLGTELFDTVSETLFQELKSNKLIDNREDWDNLQIRFLENHNYHTVFAQENREPVKQAHLIKLKQNYHS